MRHALGICDAGGERIITSDPETIEFRLFTNEAIPADLALAMSSDLIRLARLKAAFGPRADIEISEMGRGTWRCYLKVAAEVATIGAFVLMVEDRISKGEGAIAQHVAEACTDHGATRCEMTGANFKFKIEREAMPAVARVAEVSGPDYRAKIKTLKDAQAPNDYYAAIRRVEDAIVPELQSRVGRRRAFVGEFESRRDGNIFISTEERRYSLRGKIDWDAITFNADYVIIGKIVDHDVKRAFDIIDVDEVLRVE